MVVYIGERRLFETNEDFELNFENRMDWSGLSDDRMIQEPLQNQFLWF